MNPFLCFFIVVVLILADSMQMAYFTAVSSVSDSDLEQNEENREWLREPGLSRIKHARGNSLKLIRSVVFWQILTAAQCSMVLWTLWENNRFLTALFTAALVFLFGAALPGLLARWFRLKAACVLSGPCTILYAVSVPFTVPLSFAASLPARIAGIDPKRLEDEVTEDEIISMVNEGQEQGAIDTDEAEMITNIFELDDKQAHDIMTHRGDIRCLDTSVTLDEAIRYMVSTPNSRFPVYEGSIDNIPGALYLKDAMCFHLKEQYHEQSIGEIPHLLREVKFVPETTNVDDLFREMQESRKQMAIVVNEYGETSGLVTMEDILEEIVGNILDEYDREEKLIARSRDGRLRMNGKALLEDVWKVLGTTVDQDDYDTLSGYLTPKLGHIPTDEDRGEVIVDEALGYQFRILSVSGKMIGWLDVSKIVRNPESDDRSGQEKPGRTDSDG